MDWNNDGQLDILSGCYWTDGAQAAHIMMLAGNGSLDFSPAVAVENTAGKPLENVALSAEEARDGNRVLDAICTHQHAVDYDDDGDLDLIVGSFGPKFFYYENGGDAKNIQLAETPVELPVQSTSHHSGPHFADWDGDGDLDLLSGTAEGGAIISLNEGTRSEPKYSPFVSLIGKSTVHTQSTAGGKEIVPGPSTRVWAHDWNGDGLLDLLVGDSIAIVNPNEGMTEQEFQQRQEDFQKQMAELGKSQADVYQRYGQAAQSGEEISKELQEEVAKAGQLMNKLYESRKEWVTETRTGYVWLYLRKPNSSTPIATSPGVGK